MPITRRKRATPPDQPENANNNHTADQPETGAEGQALATEQPSEGLAPPANTPAAEESPVSVPTPPASPTSVGRSEPVTFQTPLMPPPSSPTSNGERTERPDYSPIEGGRRTARGELFRRPPQPPPVPPAAAVPAAPTLQPPSHEIKLPLGREIGDANGDQLHLAYNPGYTGSDEVRSTLLQQLAQESKHGGRARCWNCGSLAIVYDRWNTRSKTFGEVGIAYCEICGVWSVM